ATTQIMNLSRCLALLFYVASRNVFALTAPAGWFLKVTDYNDLTSNYKYPVINGGRVRIGSVVSFILVGDFPT
ncbi:hypothetical protein, partial [Lactiplantibacillus songbeiensis]